MPFNFMDELWAQGDEGVMDFAEWAVRQDEFELEELYFEICFDQDMDLVLPIDEKGSEKYRMN
jgi:hypothetical protein